MIVQLTPSWILTDEHSASSYGQPVLVSLQSGEAYGQADVVKAYPSGPLQRACDAIARMTRNPIRFSDEEKDFIKKFTDFGKIS